MIILGLDTAQGACSAAVLVDGHVAAYRFEPMRMGHAERLVMQAGEVLEEAGLTYASLTRLACTTGPGTFTGTRIALATGRGMALALNVPLVGVTTLEALAASMEGEGVRVASFDAKRGEVFMQAFAAHDLAPLTPPEAVGVADAARRIAGLGQRDICLGGTGAELLHPVLADLGLDAAISKSAPFPDARFVASLAADRVPSSSPPKPFYLRAPDATLPS